MRHWLTTVWGLPLLILIFSYYFFEKIWENPWKFTLNSKNQHLFIVKQRWIHRICQVAPMWPLLSALLLGTTWVCRQLHIDRAPPFCTSYPSPPRLDRSIVFASWRQSAFPSNTQVLGSLRIHIANGISMPIDMQLAAVWKPIATDTPIRCVSAYWCIGGYTRVYGVYQPPGFFDSVYSPQRS